MKTMKTRPLLVLLARLAFLAPWLAAPARGQCPDWSPGFHLPGVEGQTYTLCEHDDGSGPRLFLGGGNLWVDGVGSPLVAWDGASWSAPGTAPNGPVRVLTTHDDGSGPALYAGGEFTSIGGLPAVNGIARWNGTAWSSLGSGLNGVAHAAAAFDDGSGAALYVGGEFSTAGGVPAARIARWNGSGWSAVGTGFNARVSALAVFDDGTGPLLYAAGSFTGLNGQAAARVARWDGVAWSALGTGLSSSAHCLIVHDDGTGPALFVGGNFTTAGGIPSQKVARWRGGAWSAAALPDNPFGGEVATFAEYDDGTGTHLYAGGSFGHNGGPPLRIARWNGGGWVSVGGGMGDATSGASVHALTTFDAGAGRELVAACTFANAGPTVAENIAAWNGATWRAVVSGQGLSSFGSALTVHDDGNRRVLVCAGSFDRAGTTSARRIATWDGDRWSTLGSGLGAASGAPDPRCVLSFDDGSGPAIYVANGFSQAGGQPAANIARWNASGWSPLGGGIPSGDLVALIAHDDGSGAKVYVAGANFNLAGGIPVANIAAWDGASWASVGAGLPGEVRALAEFDFGQGLELVAGGRFQLGAGQPFERVAAWDGSTWRAVGFGTSPHSNDLVFALTAWHDGASSQLVAGGLFTSAGGIACSNVARFDGNAWSALGAGTNSSVSALASCATPSGPGLCAAGTFTTAGGVPAALVARWDGAAWSALGPFEALLPGAPRVMSLATYDARDGRGPQLFAAGSFQRLGGTPSRHIAAYSACDVAGRVVCSGDGSGAACPCGNASTPGAGAGCLNSTGNGGTLRARGLASLAQDTLALEGSAMTNGTALYFQGTQRVAGGAGAVFGDGLRCARGAVVRLEILPNSAGASHYPRAGDAPVAMKGLITAPGVRVYQIWFRDAASFCTSSTFNLTNALEVVWQP
ncbi:MAG: hypothetical protein JNK02_05485 [Planctomycetes bacterium]|nr:hypothetical protein [Planctomycetota bacterium]